MILAGRESHCKAFFEVPQLDSRLRWRNLSAGSDACHTYNSMREERWRNERGEA